MTDCKTSDHLVAWEYDSMSLNLIHIATGRKICGLFWHFYWYEWPKYEKKILLYNFLVSVWQKRIKKIAFLPFIVSQSSWYFFVLIKFRNCNKVFAHVVLFIYLVACLSGFRYKIILSHFFLFFSFLENLIKPPAKNNSRRFFSKMTSVAVKNFSWKFLIKIN